MSTTVQAERAKFTVGATRQELNMSLSARVLSLPLGMFSRGAVATSWTSNFVGPIPLRPDRHVQSSREIDCTRRGGVIGGRGFDLRYLPVS